MPFLEVKSPRGVERLELESGVAISVGRSRENSLTSETDDSMSRQHCLFEPAAAGWAVRDLGSRNGTKVNGQRISTPTSLANGDVVKAGRLEIRYMDPVVAQPKAHVAHSAPDFVRRAEERRSVTVDESPDEVVSDPLAYEARLRKVMEALPDMRGLDKGLVIFDARNDPVHGARRKEGGKRKGATDDDGEGGADSIRLFRMLLGVSIKSRATDIHVEPKQECALVRMRVDGMMVAIVEVDTSLFRRLVGVVKVLAQLDGTLKAQLQDGHFSAQVGGRRVDYRVSLTPVIAGEKLVMRVLDPLNAPTRLHDLGMPNWMYQRVRQLSQRDSGLMLACGPTGSGKTTTLYSCLREVDVDLRNVVTIEDPVEYHLEGCTQIPIDKKHEQGFAQVLRGVLRQDPDVIYVGEIRDEETAQVAMQAAMTGHLVYSTVHSKDSIGAIFRLLDLKVEAPLVANSLSIVLAQRLVRMLCEKCKAMVRPTAAQHIRMGAALHGIEKVGAAQGCRTCFGTGFVGRRALVELLEANSNIRDLILKGPTINGIRDALGSDMFVTLQQAGWQLVAKGVTSIDEVERVASGE
jgi:type II secretory ATPase GspE/PulE/Tfp pilus assembly ATPase PilB-like protein